MVMRESPVACITGRIRRNFMRFVLDDLPSYALGMRTAEPRRQHHQTNLRKSHPAYWVRLFFIAAV